MDLEHISQLQVACHSVFVLPGLSGLMLAVMMAALCRLSLPFSTPLPLFSIDIWTRIRKKATDVELLIVGRVFVGDGGGIRHMDPSHPKLGEFSAVCVHPEYLILLVSTHLRHLPPRYILGTNHRA
ncbi:Sodium/glucose cotransporter 4-like 3, partial [Homarus americanus]